MITRSELRSIPEIYKQIQKDKEQLRFLREKSTALPSQLTGTERVQSSHANNSGKYVEAAVDLENEIKDEEQILIDLQRRARGFIQALPEKTHMERLAKKTMRYRYIGFQETVSKSGYGECCEWTEIASLLGYDIRYLQRIEANTIIVLR